jgi:hypothetical protein
MKEGAMAKELLPDAFWARIAPLLLHKLHADKGYDYRHLRLALRKRRIIPLLAQQLPAPEDPLRAPG